MQIKHSDNGKKGIFRATENDKEAGILTYYWNSPDVFTIEHTVGNPEFKGIGTTLLDAAVAYARQKNVKIIPECPFAKKMFDRRPEIQDVLAP